MTQKNSDQSVVRKKYPQAVAHNHKGLWSIYMCPGQAQGLWYLGGGTSETAAWAEAATTVRREDQQALREFPTELNLLRDKAFRLGLFATAQKLDLAVKQVGWELAGDILGVERARPKKKGTP